MGGEPPLFQHLSSFGANCSILHGGYFLSFWIATTTRQSIAQIKQVAEYR
jgi:hypothetical protein